MSNLEIYCVTNKKLTFLENFNYNLSWVGLDDCPRDILIQIQNKIFRLKKNFIQTHISLLVLEKLIRFKVK